MIASERDGITAVMWKLALPGLIVGLVGCWTSSQPTSPTQPPPASASTGGAAYGGAVYGDSLARGDTYGGATYGGGTYGGATYGVLGVLQQPGQVGLISPGAGGLGPSVRVAPAGKPGSLPKAAIQQEITRVRAKVRHCYEQQLISDPALEGTVMVQFVIGLDGRVQSSVGSGLPIVDACVAQVIAAIVFPRPSGGVVAVRYPFVFRSAN